MTAEKILTALVEVWCDQYKQKVTELTIEVKDEDKKVVFNAAS